MDSRRPPMIPGYRVLRPLGQGGMGSVLLVEPTNLPGALRALKLLTVGDPERRARFLREAALLARVDRCPGVVRVHDAGEHQGVLWLCMELVEGRDLGRVLAERGPLPWEEAVRLVRELALGLAEVHARGVVHRDVKPQNVVLDAAGAPCLVDFGVAQATDLERLTLSGMAMGTPAYFSPEQTSGRPVDGRSDVYSLGVTLYELLTGVVPFPDGMPLGALVQAILHERPAAPGAVRPGVPAAVDRAVSAALEKDPARRPDAAAFAAMLEATLLRPRGASTGERLARLAARPGPRRAGLLALALLPGGLLALAALFVPGAPPATLDAPGASAPPLARTPSPGAGAVVAVEAGDDALSELEALLERGDALRAVGWLHARRDAAGGQRRALAARAPQVEATARALAVAALGQPDADEDSTVALVAVAGRLREMARDACADGADLAHAALDSVRDAARDERRAPVRGAMTDDARLVARVGALQAVAAASVRAVDRALGEQAADALLEARADGRLDVPSYFAALVALAQLDVPLEHGHLARAQVGAMAEQGSSAAAELLHLRLELSFVFDSPAARDAVRRRLLELVTGERGRGFGPVTRSHALCLGLHDGLRPTESLRLAEEARRLDPASPLPHLALAQGLLAVRGQAAAAEVGRELDLAVTRFDRDLARRRPVGVWDQVRVLHIAVRVYARIGRDAQALDLIARVRALPGIRPEWIEDLERSRRDGAAGRTGRADF